MFRNLSINNVAYDDIDEQTNFVPCAAELIRVGVLLIGPTLALWQGWQCDCPPLRSRLNYLNNFSCHKKFFIDIHNSQTVNSNGFNFLSICLK